MKAKVNRKLIDAWCEGKRDAITQLAIETRIPAGSLQKIRAGRVCQSPLYREALASALGVTEDELFPVVPGKTRAS